MDELADCQEEPGISFKRPSIGFLKGSRISSTFSGFSYKYSKDNDEMQEIPLETYKDDGEGFNEGSRKNSNDFGLGKHSESCASIILDSKDSPIQESPAKLGARSSSLDNGSTGIDSSLDTWSNFMTEFRGKLTKKVESKFNDFTSKRSPFFSKSRFNDSEKSEGLDKNTGEVDKKIEYPDDDSFDENSIQIEVAEEVSEDIHDISENLHLLELPPHSDKKSLDNPAFDNELVGHETPKVTNNKRRSGKKSNSKRIGERTCNPTCWTSFSFLLCLSVIILFISGLIYFEAFAIAISFSSGAAFMFLIFTFMYINQWGVFQVLSPGRPHFVPSHRPSAWNVQDLENLVQSSAPHYQGWMNELVGTYTPESYHEGSLISAYLALNGNGLQVLYPRNNIPKKARWGDASYEDIAEWGTFKMYNLSGSVVKLEPVGLKKSRLWRKRYPIVIHLDSDKVNSSPMDEPPSFLRKRKPSDDKKSKILKPDVSFVQGGDDEDFEILSESMGKDGPLYFFARSDREKEDWYRHFYFACRIINYEETFDLLKDKNEELSVHKSNISKRVIFTSPNDLGFHKEYIKYMSRYMLAEEEGFEKVTLTPISSKYPIPKNDLDSRWIAPFIGRLFFDFLREPYWAGKIQEKIQAKVLKLKIPNFIESLQIKELKLGSAIPFIHSVQSTSFNERGLWLDVNISYDGEFRMVLETKINLIKLADREGECLENYNGDSDTEGPEVADRKSDAATPKINAGSSNKKTAVSPGFDSEDSDGEESSLSTDSEDEAMGCVNDQQSVDSRGPTAPRKKIIRVVDQITSSSYFKKVAQTSIIKKGMERVSNTPICLCVELKYLTGCLVVNIPPPPSDRIWLGFRTPPDLWLVAKPKFGDKDIGIGHVIAFIERKLKAEFEKVTVLPNMVDIFMGFMTGFPKDPSWNPIPLATMHTADA